MARVWQQLRQNFWRQNGTPSKEERSREPERQQHIESYRFVEWKTPISKKVACDMLNIAYNTTPTTDHR